MTMLLLFENMLEGEHRVFCGIRQVPQQVCVPKISLQSNSFALTSLFSLSRQEKLQNVNGILLFDNPEAAIVSLPQIPPEPEPLNEWFNSYQVTETLGTFDRFLQDHWNNLQSQKHQLLVVRLDGVPFFLKGPRFDRQLQFKVIIIRSLPQSTAVN